MAISHKQRQILAFPYTKYDALICDGAIRSGKTTFMICAFIDDAMRRFNRQRFGICGKTVDSTVKNIISPYMAMTLPKEKYAISWKRTDKLLVVTRGDVENYFEVFGGKDESSFALIQGRTLAGVLFDEVALQPRSFVEQALARCSVTGSRLWFNCNPGPPTHWFYTEWILQPEKHNAIHLHFELRDNPALDEKIIERYETMYSGVFYDRYIRGLWVVAEGLIYPMFGDHCISKTEPRQYTRYLASMDYGIQNPTSIGIWGLCGGVWYRVKEYYHSGRETGQQKTDQQYYEELEKLAGDLPVEKLIIDPSATSFIALVNQKHRFKVWKANNDVVDGIQHTASCLQDGTIKINDCCKNAVKEFGLYRWDEKAGDDKPIKENDHAMDEIRYFVNTTQIWRKKTPYQSIF
jgi:PBSX family phage terminase large subunit